MGKKLLKNTGSYKTGKVYARPTKEEIILGIHEA